MTGAATYVYCVVKSTARPPLARVPRGIPGAARPAALAVSRSVWLIVSEVPLDTYGPGPLEQSLRDMQWVSDVAVSHEAVVEHFAKQRGTTVVPMKLFTMFSSGERAVREMAARRQELDAVLKHVGGCEEWGVRVSRAAPPAAPVRSAARATSGTAFLAARKQARDDAREAAIAGAEAAEAAFTALDALARDSRRRSDVPPGADTPPLLDAAFLVPAAARAKFKTAARKAAGACGRAGAALTLTGPWPAYNFVQGGSAR